MGLAHAGLPQISYHKSGQVGYQNKGLTLRSNLKLESSSYLILTKSYGPNVSKSVYSTPSREYILLFMTSFQIHIVCVQGKLIEMKPNFF